VENEIQSLLLTTASATETTPEVIDALNRLAFLQLEINLADSSETSEKALAKARSISYQPGEAMAHFNTGIVTSRRQEHERAVAHFKQALGIWQLIPDNKGIANAHARLGNANLFLGKYDDALEHYKIAIEIRTETCDELGAAELLNNSGTIYGLQGSHTLALKSHLKALKTFEAAGNSIRIANSSSNIGLIYKDQQNYEEALVMFRSALTIYERENNLKELSKTLNNIGNVLQEQKNFTAAIEAHTRSLHYRMEINDSANIAISCVNLGNVYKDLEEYETALSYYDRARALYTQLPDKRDLLSLDLDLGELYLKKGQLDLAHKYLEDGLKLAEESRLKSPLRKAYEIYARLLAVEKNYEEAYKFHVRFTQLDKELSNAETSRQMAQITVRHELEQKERASEIERIKNEELKKAYASLEDEKRRSEALLNNILPEEVSEELKQSGKTKARSFAMATVMFADIQNFTKISEQLTAEELVSGIDEYFEAFDKIVEHHGIEKIKTIGDAYLCVGGVPVTSADHAERVIAAAKEFLQAAKVLKVKRANEKKWTFDFRIGIHSGPVVAGVVGIKKFAYDIWGDTVNTASRMQQNGAPNHINISENTYQLVKKNVNCTYRGEIAAKNKGNLKMYFVL